MIQLAIAHTWSGEPLPATSHARVLLGLPERVGAPFAVEVDAPLYGDRSPAGPPGSTPRLWEHEVVELFIAGGDGRYLEIELGPHGHFLVLAFRAPRAVERVGLPISYHAHAAGPGRFAGQASVPSAYLPRAPLSANAYAIHGQPCLAGGTGRCHHAHAAVPGEHPDFHQPACFAPLASSSVAVEDG